jgi:uncharacterized protein Veg
MKTIATITGSIHVVSEGPIFRCIFPMTAHGDSILGGLVGHLGQTISKTVRTGDRVEVEGHFITEKTFGKVFVVERMSLPEEAKRGRLANLWG